MADLKDQVIELLETVRVVDTKIGPLECKGPALQLYSLLYVGIDGHLQAEETKVDVRFGSGKIRVYVRWAVPSVGLEWDGRDAVGTDKMFHIDVDGPGGEKVVSRNMRCVWFAVSHSVNHEAAARAIFECDQLPMSA